MVGLGSGAQRAIEDWALSRYACYLIIQNADPSKPSCPVEATGVERLELTAGKAGDRDGANWALWLDPVLSR